MTEKLNKTVQQGLEALKIFIKGIEEENDIISAALLGILVGTFFECITKIQKDYKHGISKEDSFVVLIGSMLDTIEQLQSNLDDKNENKVTLNEVDTTGKLTKKPMKLESIDDEKIVASAYSREVN